MTLAIGDYAPDFSLPGHLGEEISLASYQHHKNVVLAFYPLDWTPV